MLRLVQGLRIFNVSVIMKRLNDNVQNNLRILVESDEQAAQDKNVDRT